MLGRNAHRIRQVVDVGSTTGHLASAGCLTSCAGREHRGNLVALHALLTQSQLHNTWRPPPFLMRAMRTSQGPQRSHLHGSRAYKSFAPGDREVKTPVVSIAILLTVTHISVASSAPSARGKKASSIPRRLLANSSRLPPGARLRAHGQAAVRRAPSVRGHRRRFPPSALHRAAAEAAHRPRCHTGLRLAGHCRRGIVDMARARFPCEELTGRCQRTRAALFSPECQRTA